MQDHINTVHHEHIKISTMAAPIISAAQAGDAVEVHREIHKIMGKFVPLVLSHFMLEENILYPAIVLNHDAIDTIDEMFLIQKEHGVLEQQLKQLVKLVKITTPGEVQSSPTVAKLLITNTLDLYQTMQEHQQNEDRFFSSFGIT